MIAKAFGTAFGLTFIAEFGDKTQVAILALSARYGFLPVFLGAALAFGLLNAFSVLVGAVAARFLPELLIRVASAAVFIVFGFLSFRKRSEEIAEKPAKSAFASSFIIVSLLELGDKTQLSLIALTSRVGYPLFVFAGGTLALWATSLLGALAGKAVSRVIPLNWIRWLSGLAFIAFGALIAAGVT